MAEPACMTKRDLISYLLLDWRALRTSGRSERCIFKSREFYPTVVCTQGRFRILLKNSTLASCEVQSTQLPTNFVSLTFDEKFFNAVTLLNMASKKKVIFWKRTFSLFFFSRVSMANHLQLSVCKTHYKFS